jgi:tetratricopeptide (TPR) repeat protein
MAEVAPAAEKADRWHGWIWKMRMAEARAEIALAGGLWEEAVRFSDEALSKARSAGRIKYQALALWARGRALNTVGRCPEAIADLRAALALARQLGDPAMFLRVATSLLAIDGHDSLLDESRATARQIIASLPDEELRCRFAGADAVRSLGSLGP